MKFVIPTDDAEDATGKLMSKIEPGNPEEWEKYGKNQLILRLQKLNKSSLDYVDHVKIEAGVKPVSCFSLDGSMFALLVIEDKTMEEKKNLRAKASLKKKKTLRDRVS